MNYKSIRLLRWLLSIIIAATAGCVLFQGCSNQKPTEAPSSTVAKGTASMSVDNATPRESFSFTSGGRNYGKVDLVMGGYPNAGFECNGILVGGGTTAPDTGYSTFSTVDYFTYMIKVIGTDNATRYGQIVVNSIAQNNSAHVVTVGFDWLVQTEAGNRSLQ